MSKLVWNWEKMRKFGRKKWLKVPQIWFHGRHLRFHTQIRKNSPSKFTQFDTIANFFHFEIYLHLLHCRWQFAFGLKLHGCHCQIGRTINGTSGPTLASTGSRSELVVNDREKLKILRFSIERISQKHLKHKTLGVAKVCFSSRATDNARTVYLPLWLP
jgi:hypothetical protein